MARFQESPLHREILTSLEGITVCSLDNIASDRSATYTLDAGALFEGSVPSDDARISTPWDAAGTYGDLDPRHRDFRHGGQVQGRGGLHND